MAGLKDYIRGSLMEGGQRASETPEQYRTTMQDIQYGLGNFASGWSTGKAKGKLSYSIDNGKLRGSYDGKDNLFTKDDIKSMDFSQKVDIAKQLKIEGTTDRELYDNLNKQLTGY